MSWLDALFAGRTPPHAIEIEHTHIRVEAGNDHEERAIEYLEKADGMVYSNSFERAASVAVIGVGHTVLALAREVRGLMPH